MLYFGQAREAAGTQSENISLPDYSSVGTLMRESSKAHRLLREMAATTRIAVNEELDVLRIAAGTDYPCNLAELHALPCCHRRPTLDAMMAKAHSGLRHPLYLIEREYRRPRDDAANLERPIVRRERHRV